VHDYPPNRRLRDLPLHRAYSTASRGKPAATRIRRSAGGP